MAETSIKRHPIAAVLWGIVGGIGVSLFLIGRAQIPFGRWTAPIIIIVVMVALNLLWAYLGPAKKPKDPPPGQIEPEPIPTMAEMGSDTAFDAGFEEPVGGGFDMDQTLDAGATPTVPPEAIGEGGPEGPTPI